FPERGRSPDRLRRGLASSARSPRRGRARGRGARGGRVPAGAPRGRHRLLRGSPRAGARLVAASCRAASRRGTERRGGPHPARARRRRGGVASAPAPRRPPARHRPRRRPGRRDRRRGARRPRAAGSRRSRNDEAIVLRVEYGLASFLLASDIEAAREQALVATRSPLAATVLKVAHHGSRTSSTPAFLGAVGPAIAVISVGPRNPYGHPDPGVLERLAAAGVRPYRPDPRGPGIPRTP